MKKIVVYSAFLILVFLSIGCGEKDKLRIPFPEDASHHENVTVQQVLAFANSEAARFFPPKSRADIREADEETLQVIGSENSLAGNDTLIYVVNYKDNKGFALVSATNVDQPLLAIVPDGNYDSEKVMENRGLNLFIEAAKIKCAQESNNSVVKVIERDSNNVVNVGIDGKYHKTERKVLSKQKTNSILGEDFKWNQNGIYGQYCPNGLCGCVPLTIASIATYLGHVNSLMQIINYTYPKCNKSRELLDFTEMFKHKSSYEPIQEEGIVVDHVCTARDSIHHTIGRYCREIGEGYANYTYYNDKGYLEPITLVDMVGVHALMSKYLSEGEISAFKSFNYNDVIVDLANGPLFMVGYSSIVGHAWVCDGVDYQLTEVKEYTSLQSYPSNAITWICDRTYRETKAFSWQHWGYGGYGDGWFEGSVFTFNTTNFLKVDYSVVKPITHTIIKP